jgi:aldehyde:ferredoxin oxidoreductase
VSNLQRLFNNREGFSIQEAMIPDRVKQRPLLGFYQNKDKCAIEDYESMIE